MDSVIAWTDGILAFILWAIGLSALVMLYRDQPHLTE
ncbi:hypothetical protein J2S00_001730 [Caldalkalibacillus uzonensis]|uniref:Uncharacterized protein n=1 Tax=Caldalkalibacillus uzonensis TaxID=353224 RepID=A0ABU0CSV4_9BACI|nr:hypothetical protein [Caldalkalibacillus uzonensis]